jgi:hypothetical protein
MRPELIALRNKKQPKSPNNLDTVQYDYKYWSEIESIAKKERTASLKRLKETAKNPETPGIVMQGVLFETTLSVSEPVRSFDLELFIENILKEFPKISKPKLRELATSSVVAGSRRMTYRTELKQEER